MSKVEAVKASITGKGNGIYGIAAMTYIHIARQNVSSRTDWKVPLANYWNSYHGTAASVRKDALSSCRI